MNDPVQYTVEDLVRALEARATVRFARALAQNGVPAPTLEQFRQIVRRVQPRLAALVERHGLELNPTLERELYLAAVGIMVDEGARELGLQVVDLDAPRN